MEIRFDDQHLGTAEFKGCPKSSIRSSYGRSPAFSPDLIVYPTYLQLLKSSYVGDIYNRMDTFLIIYQ